MPTSEPKRAWTISIGRTSIGMLAFVAMMSVGYYYNVTFVQLGLKDLGERVLGLSHAQVVEAMTVLAVLTSVVALGFGLAMSRRRWGTSLRTKVRIAFVVVLVQTILTVLAPRLRGEADLTAWVVAAALALGVGVPVTFGMTVDLVPVADRGRVAAAIAGTTYLAANVLPDAWTIEAFARQMAWVMPGGVAGLALLSFRPGLLGSLERQHLDPRFAVGRFVNIDARGRARRDGTFVLLVVLMFGIFFVDSLGFLRLVDTPALMTGAWRSVDAAPRVTLGVVHLAAAFVGGVLYRAFPARHLFFWTFGIFALVHFSYGLALELPGSGSGTLGVPLLYAVAVSLYTVVNFAVWADLSTPRTMPIHAALGVAFSGWTATFLSTALAIRLQATGVQLDEHLRIVDALALVFFAAMLTLLVLDGGRSRS